MTISKYHRRILAIAIPSIVSNITVPLLGLIDIAIVGHLGNVSYIGAIAVGAMIFNLVYWIFGFLRRSEERRVGNECHSQWRSRWSPEP